MDLTIEKRERIINLLASEYIVPDEYIDCVKETVKQYATKNYSEEAIDKMVRTPQSLSRGLALLRERNGKNDLSLFRGIISEWLVCAEYNALKNKGSVILTITNPDPSSKADLLHIIDTGNGYKAIPGPDVKSGGSTYVFNQWKKIVQNRYEIPMVDIDGILTTEEGLKQLTKKQQAELEELYSKFPNKRPIATVWDKSEINKVIIDYLKYVEFNLLPSMDSKLSIKDISVPKIKEKLYSGMISNGHSYDWSVYSNESKSIFNNTMHTENLESNPNLEKGKDTQKKSSAHGSTQPVNKKKGIYRFISPTIIETSKKVVKDVGKNLKKAGVATLKFVAENPEVVAAVVVAVAESIANDSSTQNLIESDDYIDSHDGNGDYNYEDKYYYEAENLSTSETPLSVMDEEEVLADSEDEKVLSTNDALDIVPRKGEMHANKHKRKLPDGWKASPEKIATAKENGFDLQPGETWVDDY